MMDSFEWLLNHDPAIRWQVKRDVLGATEEEVAAERSLVVSEGWGAEVLARQERDGQWPAPPSIEVRWKSTLEALWYLREFGVDPEAPRVREAIDLLDRNFTWGDEFGNTAFFEGEVEPCINGRILALGAYFGMPREALAVRLLGEQLEDGGWNCWESKRSSFNTTLCVLEGLLEYERTAGSSPALTEARRRGQEYLLERSLLRSASTGRVIKEEWKQFAFPNDWYYDVLWALDYLHRAGVSEDARLAEALQVVQSKRDPSGRWVTERLHEADFELPGAEDLGAENAWITLRALRVLKGMRVG